MLTPTSYVCRPALANACDRPGRIDSEPGRPPAGWAAETSCRKCPLPAKRTVRSGVPMRRGQARRGPKWRASKRALLVCQTPRRPHDRQLHGQHVGPPKASSRTAVGQRRVRALKDVLWLISPTRGAQGNRAAASGASFERIEAQVWMCPSQRLAPDVVAGLHRQRSSRAASATPRTGRPPPFQLPGEGEAPQHHRPPARKKSAASTARISSAARSGAIARRQ